MTEPASDPIGEVLDELRALRETVERGISSATTASEDVAKLRADMARIEEKSDRRARTFRWLWGTIAAVIVAGAIAIGFGYHLENTQRACFRDWARDTAQRTERLSQASDLRIRALNDVLAVRARGGTDQQVQAAAATAAQAGEAYEQVQSENPPIPSTRVTCQSPTSPPS